MTVPEMSEFPIDKQAVDATDAFGIKALDSAPFHHFIGTKIIEAKQFPGNNGERGYKVRYQDGYESWSPAEPFEEAYTPVDGPMSFTHALHFLKDGFAVARSGWNGKGMFLYLNKGSHDFNQPVGTLIDGVDPAHFESGDTGTGTRLPNINMRSASGATVTGWLASQTDLLAEDWILAEVPVR